MSPQKSHATEETSSEGSVRMTGPTMKRKRGDSNNCHQCHRRDRERVRCTNCQKNYCISCITKWYPRMEEASVAEACPECRNICNCAACLQSDTSKKGTPMPELKLSKEDKIHYSRYTLTVLVPFLKKFVIEQNMEIEEEAKIQGLSITELHLAKANFTPNDQVLCNNCKTSILDIHRNCVNCQYNLCVTCCREIRDVFLRGNGKHHMHGVGICDVTTNGGSSTEDPTCIDYPEQISEWKLTDKGTIFCPSEVMGGCGCGDLVLNSIYPDKWLLQLLRKAEAIAEEDKHSAPLDSQACSCSRSDQESNDNYLDCPTVVDNGKPGLKHFQWHLKEGEPVIVPNVINEASGLSWEPLVLWRICRKSKTTISHDLDFTVQNCSSWCEEKIKMLQFFKGYTEGLFDSEGQLQILRLEDWPPTESLEERLPRHTAEFFRCLPFKHYTHSQAEMSLKIPEMSLKPNLAPKMYIGYGVPQELGCHSLTKLQYSLSDRVNVLMHTAEISLDPERLSKVENSRYAAQDHGDSIIYEETNKEVKRNRRRFEDSDGGAVWDVFRRQDVHKLEEYLRKHYGEFRDISSQQVVPIQAKTFYLTAEHIRKLKQEYGIIPWTFVQRLGDAVFIPAGCIHQIRNLKSCTSVAANFVSPESVGECIRLSAKHRSLPHDNQFKDDKLEVKKITLQAVTEAVEYLDSVTP